MTSWSIEDFNRVPRVAYFSMEIAIRDEMHTYAGGLGVLAGDLLRSAADLGVAIVGVTLVSRRGYFRQEVSTQGDQIERPDDWDPQPLCTRLSTSVCVGIGGHDVWVDGWLCGFESPYGGRSPVILLDTNVSRNSVEDRALTDVLYGGDSTCRLKQEMVLGIGGARMLHALGFSIREYHMNEGHSSLLALELLREQVANGQTSERALAAVRLETNFTTHTPVEAAHDRFSYDMVKEMLGGLIDLGFLRSIGGEQELNLTRLALETSGVINGVSTRNGETLFRQPIHSVSNGVHSAFWTSRPIAALFDRYVPEWKFEPELLTHASRIPASELLSAHAEAKETLIERVRRINGVELDPKKPIVTFARRMTGYKRPDLLFQDLQELRSIAREWPFQVLIAGKAHPQDGQGREMIRRIHEAARSLAGHLPVVFLPNYDLDLALKLVSGSDVWLNTPLPPLEASGTSGMKAAHNGVPSLSVLDGWWVDGCIEGVTGWAIEGGAPALYSKLRGIVLPLFYGDREAWAAVMRGSIVHNASTFNSHRMLRRYAAEVYLATA
jgi:starch phosphorylase